MADKVPKLSDDKIVALITYGVGQAVGFSESKLSKERARVQLYYDGVLPAKTSNSDSSYNSMDVFEGVENMSAQLIDTFSANKRPVKFDPAQGEPDAAAKVRTDYVTDVLFNQNGGYKLFEETIKAALKDRNSVVKVWWEPMVKTEYIHLADTTLEELQAYITTHAEEDPTVTDVDMHLDGVTIKLATLRLKKNTSQVRIELLAGEDFGISPMAVDIASAPLVFHRKAQTMAELLKAGYPKSKLENLQSDDRLYMAMEPEKLARFRDVDDLIGTNIQDDGQEGNRTMMVYESYLLLDLEEDGITQLFKVLTVGNVLLEKEPVERKPFLDFCPLTRPKSFWGTNYAGLLIQTQNARSYLMRGILRHTMVTNNPRMMVVRGALTNPKELTENRFGGLVNVSRPDGLIPLPQASLNPFVFQTMQMLKADKEDKTGISALSQGLDKDAVSKQNSGDMIHELISVSQLRQKVVARNFAENFLRELYTTIYRLVLENEDRKKIIRVAGGWVPVDLDQWPEATGISVSFSLGYGEQEKDAAMWANVHKSLESMPGLAGQYTPAQQYNVAHAGLTSLGITNIDAYLAPPDKKVQTPPNPMQQAEVAMKQADAAVKNATAQATVQKLQLEAQKHDAQHQVEMLKLQLEMKKMGGELQIKQDMLAHKIVVDAAEIEMQRQTLAQDKLTGEAMPTR